MKNSIKYGTFGLILATPFAYAQDNSTTYGAEVSERPPCMIQGEYISDTAEIRRRGNGDRLSEACRRLLDRSRRDQPSFDDRKPRRLISRISEEFDQAFDNISQTTKEFSGKMVMTIGPRNIARSARYRR